MAVVVPRWNATPEAQLQLRQLASTLMFASCLQAVGVEVVLPGVAFHRETTIAIRNGEIGGFSEI